MSQAKSGDTVKIHYTGTLADGTQFDSSAGQDPLEFALGSGQVIPGFDAAVDGMAVGDSKKVDIPPSRFQSQRCRMTWKPKSGCNCKARVLMARS